MEDRKNIEIVQQMAIAGAEPKTIKLVSGEDFQYFLVPHNTELKNLDEFMERPRKLRENISFKTIASLIDYIKRWSSDDMEKIVVADIDDPKQIKATLDYHDSATEPCWCDHKASLLAIIPPAWKVWEKHNKIRFSQKSFIHFIEDNAEDISEPDIGGLLTSIGDVKIGGTNKIFSRVSQTEEDKAAASNVKIESGLPNVIELGLAPWVHSDKYKVKARPFLHHKDGIVQFSYHLINTDRVKESAFQDCVKAVEKGTEMKVYI